MYSYDALGSFVALPLGEMAAGPVAQRIGVPRTLLGAAALVVLATGAALLSRNLRRLTVASPSPVSGG
ncbi:hypothetical protein [Kitasatospora brasiliensis]|uniref:hypothetical protein n=1 Tax=Kitasatospora brasiliensis TaxID=3058040 RepID=UPI00292E9250|nr:hypothetical protein [Kitasatospora sp. K002]